MSGTPDSVWVKVERARHHIAQLDAAASRFLSEAYTIVGEVDSQGQAVYRVGKVKPVDPMVRAITGDIVQNLRAALDHLACALWLRTNRGKECKIYFPITETAAKYKTHGPKKMKGMGQDAVDAISLFEPYGNGKGDILWRLHRLSLVDRHRLPITTTGANLGVHLPTFYPELFSDAEKSNQWILGVADMRFSLKDGDVLFRDEPGRKLIKDPKFHLFIALDEPKILERQALLPKLQEMADSVAQAATELGALFT